MATDAENLTAVRTAINNVLTYGEYAAADGHVWKSADLDKLYALQEKLQSAAASPPGGSLLRGFAIVPSR